MEIVIESLKDIRIASITGEINSRTTSQIEADILPLITPNCKLLLNMRHVTYMSSAGLRILLLLYRQINDQSGQVVLVGLQDMIRDTMAITGFLDFFQDYQTIEEGLGALANWS
ncbi:MAG: anti-sigma factor antagonist [Ardenticatenaceae bacterium]|nr:anti-sigma factor antagonist [Anaerolineales bacterium]MCB8923718.1 anti-sigma factor antagonist [Ardenticatenaceae bacterium]MCB9005712.1 anti-sigma factor antagonist [Ardenticatenaceae bacterium]